MLNDQLIHSHWLSLLQEQTELLFQQIRLGSITIGNNTMRFEYFMHGDKPQGGYSLIFGLHGGGGCPTPVNDQQFCNHKHLYDSYLPSGSIWFVPRSCEQASDMWWKQYLVQFLELVIRGFVMKEMVNSNKVFVTGYSAGGDGVYHLAPMMADYWAGAAMMAGHPNGVELFNCRNFNFSIQAGGKDEAYNRNQLARQYIQKLKQLNTQYGGFKTDNCNVFDQCGHWMQKKDAQMFASFFKQIRNPYPNLILFKQHPRNNKKWLYYVEVDPSLHKGLLIVKKQANNFYIQSEDLAVKVYVNRLMINFKQQVKVFHNGGLTVQRMPQQSMLIVDKTIKQRMDPSYIFQDCFISNPAIKIEEKLCVEVAKPQGQKRQFNKRGDICCNIY